MRPGGGGCLRQSRPPGHAACGNLRVFLGSGVEGRGWPCGLVGPRLAARNPTRLSWGGGQWPSGVQSFFWNGRPMISAPGGPVRWGGVCPSSREAKQKAQAGWEQAALWSFQRLLFSRTDSTLLRLPGLPSLPSLPGELLFTLEIQFTCHLLREPPVTPPAEVTCCLFGFLPSSFLFH